MQFMQDGLDVHSPSLWLMLAQYEAGGALAILGALAVACDTSLGLRKDQVVCYAIAAPRVGNRAFAAAYDLLVPHTWNVINDQVTPILDFLSNSGCFACTIPERCGASCHSWYALQAYIKPESLPLPRGCRVLMCCCLESRCIVDLAMTVG